VGCFHYLNELTGIVAVGFGIKQVKKKAAELRTDTAAGPNSIGPRLLTELTDQLAPALLKIFQGSMAESTMPEDWREANVTPIFKKGKKSCPSNYRPVSLMLVCCQLMASVVRDLFDHTSYSQQSDRTELARLCKRQNVRHEPARGPGAGHNGSGQRGSF
jgi:hypothetical protein